ncbi:hypothetical protein GOV14_01840 [Candidatus Pacearchaeota archaeon]|nr:hypothetical protein [Candidatus Pacearchaeota archaeon]
MQKKARKWNVRFIVFIVGTLVLGINLVSSANIGVSPASITFLNVLRGGYSERNVVISVDSEKDIDVNIDTFGEISQWLNFSVTNFTLTTKTPYVLTISVTPPIDIPNGNYSGFVRIATSSFGEGIEGHAVSVLRSFLDLEVTVNIIDREIVSCRATEILARSAEKGDDVIFTLKFANEGNIRLSPIINVDVWDQDQLEIVKSKGYVEGELLPTKKTSLGLRFESKDLEIGQYWAEVLVPDCETFKTVTFDVLKEGTLTASGVLLAIINSAVANVSDNVQFLAKFKNNGAREINAQFIGKITLGDEVVQVIELPAQRVGLNEVSSFPFYFSPRKKGKYIVSGRVFYEGKKTFEKTSSLEVFAGKGPLDVIKSIFIFLSYGVLVLLILLVAYKIRKSKKTYSKRLKRLKNSGGFS